MRLRNLAGETQDVTSNVMLGIRRWLDEPSHIEGKTNGEFWRDSVMPWAICHCLSMRVTGVNIRI